MPTSTTNASVYEGPVYSERDRVVVERPPPPPVIVERERIIERHYYEPPEEVYVVPMCCAPPVYAPYAYNYGYDVYPPYRGPAYIAARPYWWHHPYRY
jgi:hypothetical protein